METPGLAYWSAAVAEKSNMDETAYARMIAHPRFPEACVRSAHNTLDRFEGNPMVMRLAKDLSRIFYGIFALYLDARGELSLTSIQEFCVETGLTSPGRAAAILLQLRMMGFVARETAPSATRRRRYVPTPVMKDAVEDVFRAELMAMSLIEPDAAVGAQRLGEPEIFRHFILFLGNGFANIARRQDVNVISRFAARDGGMAILYQIATSGQEGDLYPPRGPVRISIRDLARRFNVSRSHVLRLLREVEELGLIRRDPNETTGYIDERLREGLKTLHAAVFMGVVSCIHRAMEAVESGKPNGSR